MSDTFPDTMNLFHTGAKARELLFQEDRVAGHEVEPILASPADRAHPDLNNRMNGSVV